MKNNSGIRIAKLVVEGLGPLQDKTFEFGQFNLIFGRNESGKTYLVEFLLRSLFRHANQWQLRDELGSGKVFLEGPGQASSFSPNNKQKLEDWLKPSLAGLPTNLARLLVVRGGELELDAEASGGADKRVLSEILSSQKLVNELKSDIQTTVQEAELVDGEVVGAHRGEIKQLRELEEEIDKVDRVLDQVETRLSGARLAQLNRKLLDLNAEKESQLKAKGHQAYLIDEEKKELEAQLNQMPNEDIEQLDQLMKARQQLEARLSQLETKLEQAQQNSMNFGWLDQAIDVWKDNKLGEIPAKNSWGLVVGIVLILLAILVQIAGLALPGFKNQSELTSLVSGLLFSLGVIGLGFYIYGLRRSLDVINQSKERSVLKEEFEKRFNESMAGLATLQLKYEKEQEANSRRSILESDLAEVERDLEHNLVAIQHVFSKFFEEVPAPEEWLSELGNLKATVKNLESQLTELKLSLSSLSLTRAEFQREAASVEFDSDRLITLQNQIASLEVEINEAQGDLEGLKGEVTCFTGNDLRDSWEVVLADLWSLREKLNQEFRTLTASVLGQIALTQVLDDIQNEEDKKIRQGLAAPEIGSSIKQMTGRYSEAKLQDEQLIIGSETADYQLADLSTGAKEQVLFALRLGFARKLAEGQPLFLLLDDAFQHSDWNRRERLVEEVVDLAKTGWQIIYLTMDNHLRDLIVAKGKPAFGDEFAAFEI